MTHFTNATDVSPLNHSSGSSQAPKSSKTAMKSQPPRGNGLSAFHALVDVCVNALRLHRPSVSQVPQQTKSESSGTASDEIQPQPSARVGVQADHSSLDAAALSMEKERASQVELDRSIAEQMQRDEIENFSGTVVPEYETYHASLMGRLNASEAMLLKTSRVQDARQVSLEKRFQEFKGTMIDEVGKWMLTMENRFASVVNAAFSTEEMRAGERNVMVGMNERPGQAEGSETRRVEMDTEIGRRAEDYQEGRADENKRSNGEKKRVRKVLGKRKRENWSKEDNDIFIQLCIDNEGLEEMELRRLIARTFRPARTHEQCANHLRILRQAKRVPAAQNEVSTGKRQKVCPASDKDHT